MVVLSVSADVCSQVDIVWFFYWEIFCRFLELVCCNDLGDFDAYPVEILVFASPTGYMSPSSSLAFLNLGCNL